jgi:DNA adenine methylase
MTTVTSVLRYPGGKSKALKFILPNILKIKFKEFREPFVGGGSVFIAVKQKTKKNVKFKINDLNKDVFCFWEVLKNNGYLFYNEISRIKKEENNGRDLFYRLKSLDSNELSDFDRAVKFFVLNRITFSGGFESSGFSEESFYKRFTPSIIEKLLPLHDLIQKIKITNTDYSHLLQEDNKDAFIFLDPPYYYSAVSKLYGKNGIFHTTFDHKKFAQNMKHISKKNSYNWLITYDDSPKIREMFEFAYCIKNIQFQYGVNNVTNGLKSKIGNELIISNFDLE